MWIILWIPFAYRFWQHWLGHVLGYYFHILLSKVQIWFMIQIMCSLTSQRNLAVIGGCQRTPDKKYWNSIPYYSMLMTLMVKCKQCDFEHISNLYRKEEHTFHKHFSNNESCPNCGHVSICNTLDYIFKSTLKWHFRWIA